MESITFLLNGFLIGLLASMPVGAIAVMSIQRTMNNGLWAGFSIGMGAAFGDFVYAAVAGFGVNFIRDFLIENKIWFAVGGGIFLIIIGYRIFTTDTIKQFREQKKITKRKMANDFVSSFILALSNPLTILGFTGFFASASVIDADTTLTNILILLISVFLGATTWWFSISLTVNHFKKKIKLRNIARINKVTGVMIILLGVIFILGPFIF